MRVQIINEAGYEESILGMGLSFGKTSEISIHELTSSEFFESYKKLQERCKSLALKQGGHNKFIESIMVWVDVTAPLYWWKQADTYRTSTKQSESTMHTLIKDELTMSDFEGTSLLRKCSLEVDEELDYINDSLHFFIDRINYCISKKWFNAANKLLPQDFSQRRIWCMSYKTLQNILNQREGHKLAEWHYFYKCVLEQAVHKDFLKEQL